MGSSWLALADQTAAEALVAIILVLAFLGSTSGSKQSSGTARRSSKQQQLGDATISANLVSAEACGEPGSTSPRPRHSTSSNRIEWLSPASKKRSRRIRTGSPSADGREALMP
jgi:hypothetical protein